MEIPRKANTKAVFKSYEWYALSSLQLNDIRTLIRFSHAVSNEYHAIEAAMLASPEFAEKSEQQKKKAKKGIWPQASRNVYTRYQLGMDSVPIGLFQKAVSKVGDRLRQNKKRRKDELKKYEQSMIDRQNNLIAPYENAPDYLIAELTANVMD